MVIGLVLGMLLDNTLNQSLLIGFGSWSVFLESPIAVAFLVVAALSILQATPVLRWTWGGLRKAVRMGSVREGGDA
jgi:putative tricarboxylic transport membrane protein